MSSTNAQTAGLYKKDWEDGDEHGLEQVIAEHYVFVIHSPDGTSVSIERGKFRQFLQEFKADVGLDADGKLMKILGVIGEEIGGALLITCYWETLGKKVVRGTGQITVRDGKVAKEEVSIF